MQFTDLFIKRPVFATVISLLIFLVGLVSYRELTVRQFPQIETSVINVTVAYPGASPQLMEGFVVTPIEAAISAVDGIDYIASTSSQGEATINIYLKHGQSIEAAINDVSDKIAAVREKLPREIKDPIISKQDPNSNPIVFISFLSSTLSPEMITDYLIRVVRPEFESVDGVSQARIFGERTYAMRIWMNPRLLAAHHLTPLDVMERVNSNNIQSAAGRVTMPKQEYNVNAKTDLNTADQFNNLVLQEDNGNLIRIRDIGHAELGPANTRSSLIIDGKKSVVIGIVPKSNANPLDISTDIRKKVEIIKHRLPADLKVRINWDASRFIDESLYEVYKTIFEACAFVVLVIYLFLGSFRSVLIPAVTIPLSLIGICSLMQALGFTINTITLLAWVLAIGMVVDDAIVVLENIHRYLERGMSPMQAALIGAREIRFAVISMTLTLAAVYAPIGFTEGLTGILFREFAFVLAGTVILSGFIALTLSPMMCSKVLTNHQSEGKLEQYVARLTALCRHRYRFYLKQALNRRNQILMLLIAIVTLMIGLWKLLPEELAPKEDQGAIMGFAMGPPAASLKYTEKYTQEIQKIYDQIPEKDSYVIINGFPQGVNSALSFLILKPWSDRKRSASKITFGLFPKFWSIPGMLAFPIEFPALPDVGGNNPVEFVLKTTADYKELNQAIKKMLGAIKQNPNLLNVDVDLKLNRPEVFIDLDRNRAADLGVDMNDINTSLGLALAEPDIGQFAMRGRSYDVIPAFYPEYAQNPEEINNLYFRTTHQELIPFSNIAKVSTRLAPQALFHFQQLRSATIKANLAPGYSLGTALNDLTQLAQKILPNNIQFDFSGESRQFIDASGSLTKIFVLAIIFIYLVLSAQFESFRDPLVVMMTVPLSISGALFALFLAGGTLNIYTQIGLVTLIGLITKHGILMVEFANQQMIKHPNMSMRVAILQAACTRLRPIIMTTATMILGALPLAFASGAGAASRNQIGWVIVGGMAVGTMFTLFVIPVMYLLLAKPKRVAIGE